MNTKGRLAIIVLWIGGTLVKPIPIAVEPAVPTPPSSALITVLCLILSINKEVSAILLKLQTPGIKGSWSPKSCKVVTNTNPLNKVVLL